MFFQLNLYSQTLSFTETLKKKWRRQSKRTQFKSHTFCIHYNLRNRNKRQNDSQKENKQQSNQVCKRSHAQQKRAEHTNSTNQSVIALLSQSRFTNHFHSIWRNSSKEQKRTPDKLKKKKIQPNHRVQRALGAGDRIQPAKDATFTSEGRGGRAYQAEEAAPRLPRQVPS